MFASPSRYTEEHAALRDTVRAFVERELKPFVDQWEEAGEFPRALYQRAGELGLLGLGFPESHGGTPGNAFHRIVATDELARCGSGGLIAGLMSHTIALPPLLAMGSEALKHRVVPPVLRGERVAALAITEPSGGSDVAHIQTTAHKRGDHYVVNGTKTFITSGMRADDLIVAVRMTNADVAADAAQADESSLANERDSNSRAASKTRTSHAAGLGGISLLHIDAASEGIVRTPLRKMGWWCSDTATIYFDDCRVPADHLVGVEGHGFLGIMQNFNNERLSISAMACAFAQLCIDEATSYARQRYTFGRPLTAHQVIRHKLVDMVASTRAARAYLEHVAACIDDGAWPVADVCMLKNVCTQAMEQCAKDAVQIFGGSGYMRGTVVERIYRETKVLAIGGGTEEIMKELAARQMGL